MSEYLTDHTQTVKCPYPFNSLYYDMTNRMGPCSLNPLVPAVPVKEYLNSKPLLQIKTDMINEVRTTGYCNERCYRILDLIHSAREFYKDFLIKVFTKKQKYNTLKFDFLTYAIANVGYAIVV